MNPRIFADFNKIYGKHDTPDDECRVVLECIGTMKDLQEQGIQLSEGLALTLYMPDYHEANGLEDSLEVDAIVEFNHLREWVGVFAWGELAYRSEKEKHDG
jgi:hypothetical protein